ncbi:MAG: fibrillarin-like rRNA/tRNA 2'-O-methyltransferase [Halobacteriales archaeon]
MSLPDGVARRDIDGRERLATRGDPVYGEPAAGGWRAWDPRRSKLAAMLDRGLDVGLAPDAAVLYLGAAAGTTVSHVADVAGPIYAVEFAARPVRDLVRVAEARRSVVPLYKDAREPETYAHVVEADLDLLVQDVATRDQAGVAAANRRFLADDGRLALAIKARSEDVAAAPDAVYDRVLDALAADYDVIDTAALEPEHADHLAVVATPRR